jgi:hypothetical protein
VVARRYGGSTAAGFAAGLAYVVPAGFQRWFGAGRRVRLVLVAGPPWRPIDVFPGSTDTRLLTVQVFRAGFDGG